MPGGGGVRGDDNWVAKFVAIVVFTTWAVSMTVGMIKQDYQPPVAIYPLLLAVAGGVFGFQISKKNGDGGGS